MVRSISMVQNQYKTECDMWDALVVPQAAFVPRIISGGGVNAADMHAPSAALTLALAVVASAAWATQW